ncbi:MAG TPA: hypothetical protein VHS76_18110 [Steroidobacteraceae bacterium]|nr:hypothetical protein [Steroidobacteraceae bacterium]
MNRPAHGSEKIDWARRPITALVWWCLPIALAVAVGAAVPSLHVAAAVWAAALLWMGVGCLLNARRCHRLHCYFSGPVLLLGAVAVGLIGFDAVSLGPHAFNNAISFTLLLALLSFVPEMFWGKYRHL